MPGGPGRMLMSFDVELLTVKPDDAASVAAWVELASQGYHVVGASAKADGSQVLFLERMSTPGNPQLPAMLNADQAAAEALRAKLMERQAAMRPAVMPHPAPATVPVPSGK